MNKSVSLRSLRFATRLDHQGADTPRGPISALSRILFFARGLVPAGASSLSAEGMPADLLGDSSVEPLLQFCLSRCCRSLAQANRESSLSGQ